MLGSLFASFLPDNFTCVGAFLELTEPKPCPRMVFVRPEAVKTDIRDNGMKSESGTSGAVLELFQELFVAIGTLLNTLQRQKDIMERNFVMNES